MGRVQVGFAKAATCDQKSTLGVFNQPLFVRQASTIKVHQNGARPQRSHASGQGKHLFPIKTEAARINVKSAEHLGRAFVAT